MEEMQGYCVIISNYRKNWPRLGIRDPEASRVLHLPASGAASPKASSPPATSTLFKIPPCPVLFIQPIYSMLIKVTFFSHLYTYSVQRRFRINYFSIPRWSSYLYFCCCFFSVFMLKVYTYSTFNWNSKMYSMLLFHAVRPWKRASCFLVGRRNSTWIQKRWAQRMGDFFSWLI